MALLFVCNSKQDVRIANMLRKPLEQGESLLKALLQRKSEKETLVDILAYGLMSNHIHLLVHERKTGGISKFMHKLLTAYSMYFNTKYERSGPLFTRPFRSKHIDSDEYFRWVFAYILLNPLELHQARWKEEGLTNRAAAAAHLQTYFYSSYADYFLDERPESRILEKSALPIEINDMKTMDDLLVALSENSSEAEMFME